MHHRRSIMGCLVVGLLLPAFFSSGCDRGGSAGATSQRAPSTQPGVVAGAPRRVISLAPHLTEIVFALGQGDRLVGVTSFCAYPPEVEELPSCGGVMDTNLERILSLRPDLILVHGEHETATRFCEQHGVQMLKTLINDLDALYAGIASIGGALGCPGAARRLSEDIRSKLDAVRDATRGKPRPRVFLSMTRQPGRIKSLFTTNGEGFLSQMLEVAGGVNVFADTDMFYPQISPAELLQRQPEVIIEVQPELELTEAERTVMRSQWAPLGSMPAVVNGRIVFMTEDYAMIPGPRLPKVAERFAELLHPVAAMGRQ